MDLLQDYAYVLLFLIVGLLFVIVNTSLPYWITKPSKEEKSNETYESGEEPIGSAWIQFDILYYLYALIFIAFDVEVLFLFPVLVAYKGFPGMMAFWEVAIFLAVLTLGILYAWKRGVFAWK